MAYFDNAATTFPKPECVYEFMNEFYRNCGGSFGRGKYDKAKSARFIVEDSRNRLKDILHCPSKEIIFEPSATISLNIIIQGILSQGIRDIYISPFEHNAVTRTLHAFEKKGQIRIHQLAVSSDLKYDLTRIRFQFEEIKPELVIISHASNVIGLVAPIIEIFTIAKEFGAITLADMAQTAGLLECDIGSDTVDFAVFAGHKTLMGPMGISGFVMKPDFNLPATLFGGTGFESANQDMPNSLPQKYEMGTMNTVGVAGLNAALTWLQNHSISAVRQKEYTNREKLLSLLKEYDFLKIIGQFPDNEYVGIISCVMDGISSDSAEMIFSERGISVRTGLQCAPLAHKLLGTFPSGTIRFSVSCLTSDEDFEKLEIALESIAENY